MRILNITSWVPYPVVSGAPLRTYNVLRRLARKHEVYLAAFAETQEQAEGINHLLEFCQQVETVRRPQLSKLVRPLGLLTYLLRGRPPKLMLSHSEELVRKIQRLVSRFDFDIVQIEHGSMGLYLEALPRALRKRSVWLLHDIDYDKFKRISLIESRVSRKIRSWVHAKTMERWMPRFAENFGLCVTMSDADRDLLISANRSLTVEVSPNGVDSHLYHPLPENNEPPALLFIGKMDYQPNIDAIIYFYRDIFPKIRQNVKDAELWIVGMNPTDAVKSLSGDGVHITDQVPDVRPYYDRCKVCIVPLRAGSGTRLKILEAMALGRPVVSTSIGCEGLDVEDGVHLFISDNPERFAEKTVELLNNEESRRRMATKARERAVSYYDWDVVTERLLEVFVRLAK